MGLSAGNATQRLPGNSRVDLFPGREGSLTKGEPKGIAGFTDREGPEAQLLTAETAQ